MRRLILAALLPVAAVLALLQGCSKPADCPKVAPAEKDVTPVFQQAETYDCSVDDLSDALQQSWCEAKSSFDQSVYAEEDGVFGQFLKGYRDGINDGRQGNDSRLPKLLVEDKKESPWETGYRKGYKSVLAALGITEFDCRSEEQASEYKDRWCEASDSFQVSGIGGDHPFVKGRFIDGYMAGGRVALTVPTSMESFFNGENPEGKQPAIVQPEGDLKGTELSFYKGFDEGYKAMIASIRESINQVMQQMQAPNNMELPEGLMPPQPGQ